MRRDIGQKPQQRWSRYDIFPTDQVVHEVRSRSLVVYDCGTEPLVIPLAHSQNQTSLWGLKPGFPSQFKRSYPPFIYVHPSSNMKKFGTTLNDIIGTLRKCEMPFFFTQSVSIPKFLGAKPFACSIPRYYSSPHQDHQATFLAESSCLLANYIRSQCLRSPSCKIPQKKCGASAMYSDHFPGQS